MTLTNTSVMYPGGTKYKNGEKCAKGTPDAGQVGVVRSRSWTLSSASQKSGSQVKLLGGKYSTKPADLKLRNAQLITLGFGPSSKPLPKVPSTTEVALLQAIEGTSAPVTTTTTVADGDDDDAHHAFDDHDDQTVHHDHDDQTVQLMKAVVLVGGEGTRLRPLTLSTPKQMLPIVGVPMLERVLAHLGSHGIDEAILSLGYLPDAFKEAYPDGHAAGISLTYAVEDEPLDTAGALRFAATYGGSRRHIRRRQRRCAHRPRRRFPHRLPPSERGGGHHRPPSGARPVGLRSGADRRRRPGDGVRREAAS